MRALILGAGGAIAILGGCMSTAVRAARPTELAVTMTGIQEVPGPGDPRMTGHGQIRVNARTGEVCWDIYARGGDPATAAHIHRGAAGVAGPPIVTMTVPDADGHSQGCATIDPETARALAFQPYNFYANVHTGPFPGGATRGQLRNDGPIRRDRRRDDD